MRRLIGVPRIVMFVIAACGVAAAIRVGSAVPGEIKQPIDSASHSGARDEAGAPPPAPAAPYLVGTVIADEEHDPAFDRYADVSRLREAVLTNDVPAVVDVGLQLAEGERILLRSHRSIRSEAVLQMAARLAARKNDTETIRRLGEHSRRTGNESLREAIDLATKLAGQSRMPADPGSLVKPEEMTVDEFARYRDIICRIRTAEATLDAEGLQRALEKVKAAPGLTQSQREYLQRIASDGIELLPKQGDADKQLKKLMGPTRGGIFDSDSWVGHPNRWLQGPLIPNAGQNAPSYFDDPPNPPQMTRWDYNMKNGGRGCFIKQGGSVWWSEFQQGVLRFTFREVQRRYDTVPSFVDLFDNSRGLYLRLTADNQALVVQQGQFFRADGINLISHN